MKVMSFIYIYEEEDGNKVIIDLNIFNRDLLIFLNGFNNNDFNGFSPFPEEINFSGSGTSAYRITISDEAYKLFQEEWFKKHVDARFGARIIKGKWEDLK